MTGKSHYYESHLGIPEPCSWQIFAERKRSGAGSGVPPGNAEFLKPTLYSHTYHIVVVKFLDTLSYFDIETCSTSF